jgi:acyl-coenzyme A synthetase/AMP-(fatty) acid ligase
VIREEGRDTERVTRLTALVVAPGLSAPQLLEALRQRIDPAFLPRPLLLVDTLPRNATGKLSRAALDELLSGRAPKSGWNA